MKRKVRQGRVNESLFEELDRLSYVYLESTGRELKTMNEKTREAAKIIKKEVNRRLRKK